MVNILRNGERETKTGRQRGDREETESAAADAACALLGSQPTQSLCSTTSTMFVVSPIPNDTPLSTLTPPPFRYAF